MYLRPFTIDDAPIILSWIKDITAFRKWSVDRYPAFPPKPKVCMAAMMMSLTAQAKTN